MGEEQPGMAYTIPYEKQLHVENNRTCGAACLSMVYRSLGQEVPQDEIWAAISKVNRFGSLASTTHLMVSDALKRGFDAVAIKARHPIFALRCLRDTDVRVILNHRLHQDVPTGHYSVMVDIGNHEVTLHDPYFGPSRRIPHVELMQVWEPGVNSEIVGQTLIGIAPRQADEAVCEICRTAIPAAVNCPQCGKPVPLRPAKAIGCIAEACVVRRWISVCCPSCDYMWNFAAAPPPAAQSAPEKAEKAEDPFQLGQLFAALDKFCATVVAMPMVAGNAEVMKHIDFLKGSKDKLTEAAAKDLANYKAQTDKMAARLHKSQQAKEAHNKKVEELKTPSPPLDGNALGLALLKNLGLIRRTGLTDAMKL
ncbi:MAG: cysteine peptidase family C39 domain-containing protein [Acidobacteriota bacterium]|nr:cysteine peptidase family C39 domain-containing protein [Acidobacteriota bacterium]